MNENVEFWNFENPLMRYKKLKIQNYLCRCVLLLIFVAHFNQNSSNRSLDICFKIVDERELICLPRYLVLIS